MECLHKRFILRLAGLSFLATAPLWGILAFTWPVSSDFISYATIAKSFSTQFWGGDLFPRWLSATNAGYGSPVFVFYSPLSFYITSLLGFLSSIDPNGFGRIILSMTLALFASGITCHRWLSTQMNEKNARDGALLYAVFPYLALHVYGGFAAPQLWGIALFPLLLETAASLSIKGMRGVAPLALAYGALCLTHLPSLLFFGAVPLAYAVMLSPRERRVAHAGWAALAAMLGVALAAFYFLPAIANKQYIAAEHFLDGNLIYAHNFLDTYSLIGIALLWLPLAGLYVDMPNDMRKASMTKAVRFWLIINTALLFMALPISKFLWDALPPLQHLQFPFRFFLAMLPGAVFIALNWLPHTRNRWLYPLLCAAAFISAAIYSEETAFSRSNAPSADILANSLLARPEYQTRWMEKEGIDFRLHVPPEFRNREAISFAKGKGSLTLLQEDARHITLDANVESPQAVIALHRLYFPGWRVEPGDFPSGTVSAIPQKALLSLWLPKGKYEIRLALPWFAGEKAGVIISLLAAASLLTLARTAQWPYKWRIPAFLLKRRRAKKQPLKR